MLPLVTLQSKEGRMLRLDLRGAWLPGPTRRPAGAGLPETGAALRAPAGSSDMSPRWTQTGVL